jgi:selenophosphate synthetase-related protein
MSWMTQWRTVLPLEHVLVVAASEKVRESRDIMENERRNMRVLHKVK